MPRKSLTLNGFAGGVNEEADISDLRSDGGGQDELLQCSGFSCNERGKIVQSKRHLDGGYGVNTIGSWSEGATEYLIYDDKIYRETGVYKMGDAINWSGNEDYYVNQPNAGNLNSSL